MEIVFFFLLYAQNNNNKDINQQLGSQLKRALQSVWAEGISNTEKVKGEPVHR